MRIVGSGAPTGNPGTWGYATGGEARTAPRSCTGGTPLPRLGAMAILAMPAPGQDAQATAGETPAVRLSAMAISTMCAGGTPALRLAPS